MKLRDLFVRIGFDVDEKPIKWLEDGIRGLKIFMLGSICRSVCKGICKICIEGSRVNETA